MSNKFSIVLKDSDGSVDQDGTVGTLNAVLQNYNPSTDTPWGIKLSFDYILNDQKYSLSYGTNNLVKDLKALIPHLKQGENKLQVLSVWDGYPTYIIESTSNEIIFNYDSVAPTASNFSPVDEATAVAIDSNIVVTFNESIKRGSGDIVLKEASGTTVATYTQNSSNVSINGNTLIIDPTADLNYSTSYVVEFAAGAVQDLAGNDFAGTTAYNFATENDSSPPVLLNLSPKNGSNSVALDAKLKIKFNEFIKLNDGVISLKNLKDGTTSTYNNKSDQITIDKNELTISPSEILLPDTQYRIEFQSGMITDFFGNSSAPLDYSFYTVDKTPPEINSISPRDTAANIIPNTPIEITFSESIFFPLDNRKLIKIKSSGVDKNYHLYIPGESSHLKIENNILTIKNFTQKNNSTYKLTLEEGSVVDASGNPVKLSTFEYSTTDTIKPTLVAAISNGKRLIVNFSENVWLNIGNEWDLIQSVNIFDSKGHEILLNYSSKIYSQTSKTTYEIDLKDELKSNEIYYLNLADGIARDFARNTSLAIEYPIAFDDNSPLVEFSSPVNNALAVEIDSNIVLKFNEIIKRGSGEIVLKKADGVIVAIYEQNSSNVSISGSTLTIEPSTDLNYNTSYKLEFAAGAIQDLAGNNYNGSDSFTFKVNDGKADSAVATAVSVTTDEDTAKTGTLAGTDVEGSSLTFAKVADPTNGTVTINATTGAYTYTPNANYNGSDSFTFKVNDGNADSSVRTVSFTVRPVNDEPIGISLATMTAKGTPKTGNLTGTDSDGDILTFSQVKTPSNGSVILNSATGAFTYTPNANFLGNDSFTFKVNDGKIDSQVANVSINVQSESLPSVKFWNNAAIVPTDNGKSVAIDLSDAIAILKMIVGLNVNGNNTPLSPYQALAADFNQNGEVGLDDAIGVLKKIVGLSSPEPIWKYFDNSKIKTTLTAAESLSPKDWINDSVITNLELVQNVNVIGVLTGDVNGSWI
jgi:methionine-rich copper-binding protein CopC